jgi:hypothetical protein
MPPLAQQLPQLSSADFTVLQETASATEDGLVLVADRVDEHHTVIKCGHSH